MNLIYTRSFDKTTKNVKGKKEKDLLNKILNYIENESDFISLVNNPMSRLYKFERLKYDKNEFYSFRLSRIMRLVIKPKDNNVEVYLVYISKDHYDDFDRKRVILDEK